MDFTTAMRMPCASTWSGATAAPVSLATLGMGLCAKVSTAVLVVLFIVRGGQPTQCGETFVSEEFSLYDRLVCVSSYNEQ